MADARGNILLMATRSLSHDLSAKIEESGLRLRQFDFIEVSPFHDAESFKESWNNDQAQARVFTSKNAVKSVASLLATTGLETMPKKTFTVGIKATQMLADLGIETNVTAGNAISLAQIIARNKDVTEVDFFCGNKSLDDLPEYLKSKGIAVNKEVVYHTEMVCEQVETQRLDGLLFLSPSAVYSFFKKNKIKTEIPCFCIGATTSEAVHLRCNNPRILADEPSIASVVEKVIGHFENVKS